MASNTCKTTAIITSEDRTREAPPASAPTLRDSALFSKQLGTAGAGIPIRCQAQYGKRSGEEVRVQVRGRIAVCRL